MVEQFRDVTGMGEEVMDDDTVAGMLAARDWQLEAAVRDFFDPPSARGTAAPPPASSTSSATATRVLSDEDYELDEDGGSDNDNDDGNDAVARVRRRGMSPPSRNASNGGSTSSTPPDARGDPTPSTTTTPTNDNSLLARLLRPLNTLTGAPTDVSGLSAAAAARKFSSDFHAAAAAQALRGPEFLQTSFEEALAEAASLHQALVVYLHAPMHPLTPVFARDVLCAPAFAEVLSRERVRLWGGSVQRPDGWVAAERLNVAGFPSLVVLSTSSSAASRARVVDRLTFDGEAPASVLSRVAAKVAMAAASSAVGAAPMDRGAAAGRHTPVGGASAPRASPPPALSPADEERRRLIAEQNAELQRALEEDRNREEAKRRREEEERRAAEEERKRVEEYARVVEEKRARTAEPATGGTDVTTLRLNLPGGSRLQRRFLKSQRLVDVRDALDVHFHDNGKSRLRFALSTNMPKKVFEEAEEGVSLEEAKLVPNGVLFVTDLDA